VENFSPKNVGKKWNFPRKKFRKIVLPTNSTEFSAEKMYKKLAAGPNPTSAIYKASVVKIYNATNSLARFLSKNYFSTI
jgi:hypothetical protein